MIRISHIKIPLLILCYFYLTPVLCESVKEVIYLEADSVKYDYRKGIVTYKGSVHGTQGSTELLADEMYVYYNKDHKIEKIIAIGNLAHYKTRLKEGQDLLVAESRKIYYRPLVGKVILENEAKIDYNQNHFEGPYIIYDINNKNISSLPHFGESQNSRTRITIEPIKQLKQK